MTYEPYYKQIGHFIERETVYCNLNGNMVEGVGRLSSSRLQVAGVMGRETLYLCYDLQEVLQLGGSNINATEIYSPCNLLSY